ncbi:MAG: OadG family protein [Lachnospiraceae bacterium]|nr:OadG family protein [Lachnospiraceae bacterium]
MKKFLTILCMFICLLGVTACEQPKPVDPEDSTTLISESQAIVTYLFTDNPDIYGTISMSVGKDISGLESFEKEGPEFTETILRELLNLHVEGNGFVSGVDSWKKATAEIGNFKDFNDAKVIYGSKGDTFIVDLQAQFEKRTATIEFVYKDDLNKTLTSYAVNVDYTFGEKMEKAGLNTLLGMGTVFIVLILLSFLISCFNLINKAQASMENRKKEEAAGTEVKAAPAPAAPVVTVSGGDDEIAAVISAAIAAYESESGVSLAESGGYYVRSIRRRSNNKWNKN